jgi:thioredoxin
MKYFQRSTSVFKFFVFCILISCFQFSCDSNTEQKSSNPTNITENDFQQKIKENKIVLFDFSATWCVPCKRQATTLESFEKNMKEKILVVKVDVDQNREIANKMNIAVLPTLILFKNGSQVWRSEGLTSESTIKGAVENN